MIFGRHISGAIPIVIAVLAVLLPLDSPGAESLPRASFEKVEHDFGRVEKGEVLSHNFTVRNLGDAPLRFEGTRTSLPDITVRMPATVAPGSIGTVKVEWDTGRIKRDVEAEISLQSNDPGGPALLLLKALVIPPIDVVPYSAVFFSVFEGEEETQTLSIVNHQTHDLNITAVHSNSSHVEPLLEADKPGRRYLLNIALRSTPPPGRYREALYLETDDPAHPRLKVLVNVLVKEDVHVTAKGISFGLLSKAELLKNPSTADFLIQSFLVKRRQGSMTILDAVSNLPFLEITHSPEGASQTFRIDVGLAVKRLEAGKIAGTVRILTDDPKYPEIALPVRGEVQ